MIQAVFFDLDDTLYDHLTPFQGALKQILHTPTDFPYEKAYHRMRYYSDLLSDRFGGTPTSEPELSELRHGRFRSALKEFELDLSEEQAAAVQQAYYNKQFEIELFKGAKELIEALQSDFIIVGIITNGPLSHQMKKIEALNLKAFIPLDAIFVSGDVGYTKPDVGIFDHVANKIGLIPTYCYYIGDSWRNDVIGALDAGWKSVWFNHRNVQPATNHRPHFEVKSYDELHHLLIEQKKR
jgi:putative hydrolase of the HAD superfamily